MIRGDATIAEDAGRNLDAGDGRRSKRRRRPSGEPPPLPRRLQTTGKYWVGLMGLAIASWVGLFLIANAGAATTRVEVGMLQTIHELRVPWLTEAMHSLHSLGSEWVTLVLRWAVILVLLPLKRFRHLMVFIGSTLVVGLVTTVVSNAMARPRPLEVDILGHWQGASHPSRPVAAFAATLIGIAYTLVVPGRPRTIAKWATAALLLALGASRLYLGVDHPTDVFAGITLGITIPLVMFRMLTPNEIFPVTYSKRRAAHLDITGARLEAIRQAVETQLGISIADAEPFGLGGSAGSTPLKLTVAGEPKKVLFGKLYAQTHLRSDRWYKLGRTLLYGRLEDEAAFQTVRRLVQYEDYLLRVMRDGGLPTPRPYGFVEITPEREYMLVTEFVPGAKELLEAELDDAVLDQALGLVRKMWEVGVAHRDVKPSNLLLADGKVHIIDVAFGEVRPSPWREAVDLANMMLVLALRTDAARVYRAALKHFSPKEIGEAFAASHGMTMPSQSRTLLKQKKLDLIAEFRKLAPERPPISIQRWSIRRVGLTLGVLLLALITFATVFSNFRGAGLQPPADATTVAYSGVTREPRCEREGDELILLAQAVPTAALLPCVEVLPVGWSFAALDIVDGRARMFLDSDRAGFHAVDVRLARSCDLDGATEVPTDEPGTRRYERVTIRPNRYVGARHYVFGGGCVTYEFDLSGPGRTALAEEATLALSFYPREEGDKILKELTGMEI